MNKELIIIILAGIILIFTSNCKKDDEILSGVADIEGNVYDTVRIGTQVWMTENLKVTKYNDGGAIPKNTQWILLTAPAYCWYNNTTTNKDTYGALYNWYVVETGKLCPKGWHVPTTSEWTTLINSMEGDSIAGGKLKETGISHWKDPNTGAIDEIGFKALPGGCRDNMGVFLSLGESGFWWSSTGTAQGTARNFDINYEYADIFSNDNNPGNGFSVRCIKD